MTTLSHASTMRFIMLLLVAAALHACDQGGSNADTENKQGYELISDTELHRRMKAKIDSMEQRLYTDSVAFDPDLMIALRDTYDDFARRFDGDEERSPEFLYKSAAISRGMGQPMDAIKKYDLILRKFKGYERGPEVQFLIAFTYDEDMREKDLAKEAYNEVMRKFPHDHWAIQAEKRLETIDMSDEELIKFFMEQQEAAKTQ